MTNTPRTALLYASAIALGLVCSGTAFAQGTAMSKMPMGQTGQVTRRVIAENAKLTVSDVLYRPGDSGSVSSKEGVVAYIVSGGTIERTFADGSKEAVPHRTGETLLIAEKRPYSTKNIGKTTVHEIVVQLK